MECSAVRVKKIRVDRNDGRDVGWGGCYAVGVLVTVLFSLPLSLYPVTSILLNLKAF